MKIAVIHSFYKSDTPSGENDAVLAQCLALQRAGHEVQLISRRTDLERYSFVDLIKAGIRVIFGTGLDPLPEIQNFSPDIVHIHNLFPNYGDRWISRVNAPIFVTLHNFRSFCANGFMLRESNNCSLCPDKSSFFSIINKCYRDSTLATIPLALSTRNSGKNNRLISSANRIIALSSRSKNLFRSYMNEENALKIEVIPNFYSPPDDVGANEPINSKWIFAGRLSAEKGILELIDKWPKELRLSIFGNGPLLLQVNEMVSKHENIEIHGLVNSEDVYRALRTSRKFVFPSIWPEGAVPLVFLQALAASAFTISTRENAVGDFLNENSIGRTVLDPRDIGKACLDMSKFELDCSNVRELFDDNFTESIWIKRIEKEYRGALDSDS